MIQINQSMTHIVDILLILKLIPISKICLQDVVKNKQICSTSAHFHHMHLWLQLHRPGIRMPQNRLQAKGSGLHGTSRE